MPKEFLLTYTRSVSVSGILGNAIFCARFLKAWHKKEQDQKPETEMLRVYIQLEKIMRKPVVISTGTEKDLKQSLKDLRGRRDEFKEGSPMILFYEFTARLLEKNTDGTIIINETNINDPNTTDHYFDAILKIGKNRDSSDFQESKAIILHHPQYAGQAYLKYIERKVSELEAKQKEYGNANSRMTLFLEFTILLLQNKIKPENIEDGRADPYFEAIFEMACDNKNKLYDDRKIYGQLHPSFAGAAYVNYNLNAILRRLAQDDVNKNENFVVVEEFREVCHFLIKGFKEKTITKDNFDRTIFEPMFRMELDNSELFSECLKRIPESIRVPYRKLVIVIVTSETSILVKGPYDNQSIINFKDECMQFACVIDVTKLEMGFKILTQSKDQNELCFELLKEFTGITQDLTAASQAPQQNDPNKFCLVVEGDEYRGKVNEFMTFFLNFGRNLKPKLVIIEKGFEIIDVWEYLSDYKDALNAYSRNKVSEKSLFQAGTFKGQPLKQHIDEGKCHQVNEESTISVQVPLNQRENFCEKFKEMCIANGLNPEFELFEDGFRVIDKHLKDHAEGYKMLLDEFFNDISPFLRK